MNTLAVVSTGSSPHEKAGSDIYPLENFWFPTFSGSLFDVLDHTTRDINIRDIAHSLSMQCRFGGHCQRYYSLAEHCVILSRLVDKRLALCALLHEAAHAYVQEMSVPLRPLLEGYQELAQRIWGTVAKRFHLPATLPEAIRKSDLRLLATEIEFLLLPTPKPWLPGVRPYTLEALGIKHSKQLGLLPREARQHYLERFAELVV
uniref:HD superfamily hydrolase n=1 Tax=Desulfovibrio sp. U5L TaxID=596152 RepID=I2PWP0_9BACT